MYNQTELIPKLSTLIGFRPHFDQEPQFEIDEDLTVSDTGVFVQDLHPLLRTENLVSVSPQDRQAPEQSNLFSIWLRETREAAVRDVVLRLQQLRLSARSGRNLQDNTALFRREGISRNAVTPEGRFVGFRISIVRSNLAAVLQRVGLQFLKAQTLKLYVYSSEKAEAIKSFDVVYANAGRFQYFDLEELPLNSVTGSYFIGYFESDLIEGNRAIKSDVEVFADRGCGGCGYVDRGWRNAWANYISVRPVSGVPLLSLTDNNLTEEGQNNFGLNLVFSFRCDLTDYFTRERYAFANAVQASLRLKFLQAMAFSTNQNFIKSAIQEDAFNEVQNKDNSLNPSKQYDAAIEQLGFEFSKLDSLCRPSVESPRITVRAV